MSTRLGLYQDAGSNGSATVSLTISHRSLKHILLSALALLRRNTMMSPGWDATNEVPAIAPNGYSPPTRLKGLSERALAKH